MKVNNNLKRQERKKKAEEEEAKKHSRSCGRAPHDGRMWDPAMRHGLATELREWANFARLSLHKNAMEIGHAFHSAVGWMAASGWRAVPGVPGGAWPLATRRRPFSTLGRRLTTPKFSGLSSARASKCECRKLPVGC
eukprot:COSAG04_NODE_625_length_11793_cov_11.719942_7_plen_137_part_00